MITRSQAKRTSKENQASELTESTNTQSKHTTPSSLPTSIVVTESQPSRKMSEIKEAFEQIDKFLGDEHQNVEKWLQKVDGMCACFDDITDQDKLKRIPTKLGGSVFDWFNENKAAMIDWQSFKKNITEKYPVNVMKVHPLIHVDNFNKRCKRDEETIVQYYQGKMELANKVDPRMIESMRVAALIDGLPSSLRRRLAYKKTEMLTPEKFLLMAQALEQELELISRELLEEQMSHLSIKATYPNENQDTGHLVTSIRNTSHNEEKQQPMHPTSNNNYNDQQKFQQVYASSEPSANARWHNDHRWKSRQDFPNHQDAYSRQQTRSHQHYDNQKQEDNPWKPPHQQQHQQINDHHWTKANNNGKCFTCGEFGHIARHCQRRHLKE
jgi:hypothetical protein